jgi:predicted permease
LTVRAASYLNSLWRTLVRRSREQQALHDELAEYVDLLTDEYERAGLAPEAARRRALVDTGGVEQVKEATRDVWRGAGVANAARELRFTLRALRNAPAFSAIAIAILAIGIAGATAIFTVIKGSLLRPLPAVSHPSSLVSLEPTKGAELLYDFSYLDYRELRDQSRTLAGLAGYDGTSMTVEDRWAPRHTTWVSYVTGNFFAVLGTTPAVGRLFGPSDEATGNPVVVLAYDFWQSRHNGDPRVVGATIRLADHRVTVIGVAQPRFIGAMLMHPMQIWIPLTALPSMVDAPGMLDSHDDTYLRLVGRLAIGRTVADAQDELSVLAARLAKSYPADAGHGIKVFAGAGMTNDERSALAMLPRLLAFAVGLLLLIACANVANLSLVRAASQRRELATRLALGASRRSLVTRQLLEGGALGGAGALFGVVIAQLLVRSQSIVKTVAGMPARVGLDVSLDYKVLIVALGATVLTTLVVSVAPVLHVLELPPGAVLKDGAAGAVRRRSFGQRALVAAQIAASVVLLASAAMVFDGFHRVLATNPGFDARGLTTASPDLWQAQLDTAQMIAYRREWLREAGSEPSIAAVAVASVVPPAPWDHPQWVFRAGEEPPPDSRLGDSPAGGMHAYVDVVSPAFFDVMHLPIAFGRSIAESDNEGAAPVVVVSRRLAANAWPNESPLGKMLSLPALHGRRQPPMRVIGVTGDVRYASVFTDAPAVAYVPIAQHPGTGLTFVMRSRDGRSVSDTAIHRIGARVNARVPMYTNDVAELIDDQLHPQRVASAWIGAFGVIALLLAAIGLYGVVAQGVLQRTRELAVRSALGATPGGLTSLVIGGGVRIAAIGVTIGVLAGAAVLRVLESQFAGVSIVDARAAAVAIAILCATMIAACYLPARRASRLDPAAALRCD